ncbi:MAG: magnesium and cobalt transport protein CorA, partial [Proteobacteria bacterium]|nr:magnesium and cobalt transport protein CorA [Pseudomonadota bacterium]
MFDFLKSFELKKNQSPGSLIYAGEEKDFEPKLKLYSYDADKMRETDLDPDGDDPTLEPPQTHFLDLSGLHHTKKVSSVGGWLGLHPLILEDALNTGHRPKLQWQDDILFLVLKNVSYDAANTRLHQEQVSLAWSGTTVLALREDETDIWEGVLQRLRRGRGRLRSAGPAYLLVALVDALIDRGYQALAEISGRAEDLEEQLMQRLSEKDLLALYQLRRDVILLRNVLQPTRDALTSLERDEDFEEEEARPFLSDVADHALQTSDAAQALSDILTGMIDAQISLAGLRMNQVMKVLTVVTSVFIPLSFLTGIYGMNFDNM